MRLWDVFESKGNVETFQLTADGGFYSAGGFLSLRASGTKTVCVCACERERERERKGK